MTYSQTLLTELKASKDGISDYRVAQILNCTRQHISRIKNGEKGMSESMVVRAAKMAGLDPEDALLKLLVDRAESEEIRQILERIGEKINVTKH